MAVVSGIRSELRDDRHLLGQPPLTLPAIRSHRPLLPDAECLLPHDHRLPALSHGRSRRVPRQCRAAGHSRHALRARPAPPCLRLVHCLAVCQRAWSGGRRPCAGVRPFSYRAVRDCQTSSTPARWPSHSSTPGWRLSSWSGSRCSICCRRGGRNTASLRRAPQPARPLPDPSASFVP